ncbi:MAG: pyridoxal-phosphate dependent enzyme [Pseudomonadota bacterium]
MTQFDRRFQTQGRARRAGSEMLYASILDTIGNTPTVRINNLGPAHVELYAKLEAFNPLGSVKDRFALAAIEAAEAEGALKPGQTVVEATSGNTGIGLAMVCAQKGYPLVVTMAENFSVERRKLMRFLGAKVVLTPASEKGSGMVAKAEELAAAHGWFLARQFENEANAEMHARTTAPEILEAFGEDGLDIFVTGYGTGGTLNGVSRVFKARSPRTRIVLTEPDNVPVLGSGIAQPRDEAGRPTASHPMFRPHLMQGWSPDFIPHLAEAAKANIDAFQPVSGADALTVARDLAAKEGIFCGISGGATVAAAISVAEQAPEGSKILAMIPDTGERYISTALFDEVAETMTDEEMEISRSTAGYRFDVSVGGTAAGPAEAPKPHATAFVDDVIGTEKVVMFALEWCEFCWSVRKLFAAAGIAFHSVDLDSVAFQKDNLGGEIRVDLRARTGAPTIPQIFVGGTHIGGATDAFDRFNDGSLKEMLAAAGVPFDPTMERDAYSFLPSWLHPR